MNVFIQLIPLNPSLGKPQQYLYPQNGVELVHPLQIGCVLMLLAQQLR